jgi:hypothetical protein
VKRRIVLRPLANFSFSRKRGGRPITPFPGLIQKRHYPILD